MLRLRCCGVMADATDYSSEIRIGYVGKDDFEYRNLPDDSKEGWYFIWEEAGSAHFKPFKCCPWCDTDIKHIKVDDIKE